MHLLQAAGAWARSVLHHTERNPSAYPFEGRPHMGRRLENTGAPSPGKGYRGRASAMTPPPPPTGGFRNGEGGLRANPGAGPRPNRTLGRRQVADGHRHHGSLGRALGLHAKSPGFEPRWWPVFFMDRSSMWQQYVTPSANHNVQSRLSCPVCEAGVRRSSRRIGNFMLFQPTWPEKTGNSKAAGAIGLRHRPPMGPS